MKKLAVVWGNEICQIPESKILVHSSKVDSDYCGLNDEDKKVATGYLRYLYGIWKNKIDVEYLCLLQNTHFFMMNDDTENGMTVNISGKEAFKNIVKWKDSDFEQWSKEGTTVVTQGIDVRTYGCPNVLEYFISESGLPKEAIDLFVEIVNEISPEVCIYLNQAQYYCGKIFSCSKDTITKYCERFFLILEEIEKKLNTNYFSKEQESFMIKFHEVLFGAFVFMHLNGNTNIGKNMLLCKHVHFENAATAYNFKPAFDTNNIAVTLISSDYFAPYASVTLQSIIDRSSNENNYDIFILSKDMSEKNKVALNSMVKKLSNFSLRFIDVRGIIPQTNFFTIEHFTIESYFRTMIPYVLPNHNKIVYCDCDLIWKKDIAELYNKDIGDNLMGAVIDPIYSGLKNENDFWRNHNNSIIGTSEENAYTNTGVIIMNIKLFRKLFSFEYFIFMAAKGNYIFCDQDALNVLCKGKTYFLEQAWNSLCDTLGTNIKLIERGKKEVLEDYIAARKDPYVIHYADKLKPWVQEKCDRGYAFWQCARKSPLYELILHRMSYEILNNKANQRGIVNFPKELNI